MDDLQKTASKAIVERKLRDWFARSVGVGPDRKEEIYHEVFHSASLRDVSYWLQVFFSAGIATLGLVLNSPAVIIGAMLISPLMGPILACGLALAVGDLILGFRAIITLLISCVVAVVFAMLLVYLLPFKDQTAEIIARTHPNTLDLIVALFSGAVGSVAVCKKVKGVVTSIPGVAIAVALMPPLCVVGFGLGVAVSEGGMNGLKVASGGGLLFLTNLVAIVFTAMIVFFALHIDIQRVKNRVHEWRTEEDEAGRILQDTLAKLPGAERIRKIGGLPGRFLIVVVIILIIFIPLSRSFQELKDEIALQKTENHVRQIATEVWEQNFTKLSDGTQRSYLGQMTITNPEGKLSLVLRVFTVKPFTPEEKNEFARLVAERIKRPASTVDATLIQIPTATGELLTKAHESTAEQKQTEPTLDIPELQKRLSQSIETLLANQQFPRPAQLVSYLVALKPGAPLQVQLFYLSDHEIGTDAQQLISDNLKSEFSIPDAVIVMTFIPGSPAPISFGTNRVTLDREATATLDQVGRTLTSQPGLSVEITTAASANEREGIADERSKAITDYLASTYSIDKSRISVQTPATGKRDAMLAIKVAGKT